MSRAPRSFFPGAVYHLTAHGTDDRMIFLDDIDRQAFAMRLRRIALRDGWTLYAVCLMDTHYHLVLQPAGEVSSGMRVLNGAHARAFNSRHGRRGALFESRFFERSIRGGRHLARAIAYVEHNAVAAGVVSDPADWPWSTYGSCTLRVLLAACLKKCLTPSGVRHPFGRWKRPQATSRSLFDSARARSFFRPWFSICRMRSRVTWNARPTSSSVRGCSPFSPYLSSSTRRSR